MNWELCEDKTDRTMTIALQIAGNAQSYFRVWKFFMRETDN
jgi:hypothetical protein